MFLGEVHHYSFEEGLPSSNDTEESVPTINFNFKQLLDVACFVIVEII